jgi:hypothetical protein
VTDGGLRAQVLDWLFDHNEAMHEAARAPHRYLPQDLYPEDLPGALEMMASIRDFLDRGVKPDVRPEDIPWPTVIMAPVQDFIRQQLPDDRTEDLWRTLLTLRHAGLIVLTDPTDTANASVIITDAGRAEVQQRRTEIEQRQTNVARVAVERLPSDSDEATTSGPVTANESAWLIASWDRIRMSAPVPERCVNYLAQRTGLSRARIDQVRRMRNICAHPAEHGLPERAAYAAAQETTRELLRRLAEPPPST